MMKPKARARANGRFAPEHGRVGTFEYRVWAGIIRRCHTPSATGYEHYGGRGIAVCERWRGSFEAFLEDMGHAPSSAYSIERKDHELGYFQDNCMWLLRVLQNRNTRRTLLIEFRGMRKSLATWCDELGLPYWRTHSRIHKLGWSVERALTDDVQPLNERISNISGHVVRSAI